MSTYMKMRIILTVPTLMIIGLSFWWQSVMTDWPWYSQFVFGVFLYYAVAVLIGFVVTKQDTEWSDVLHNAMLQIPAGMLGGGFLVLMLQGYLPHRL